MQKQSKRNRVRQDRKLVLRCLLAHGQDFSHKRKAPRERGRKRLFFVFLSAERGQITIFFVHKPVFNDFRQDLNERSHVYKGPMAPELCTEARVQRTHHCNFAAYWAILYGLVCLVGINAFIVPHRSSHQGDWRGIALSLLKREKSRPVEPKIEAHHYYRCQRWVVCADCQHVPTESDARVSIQKRDAEFAESVFPDGHKLYKLRGKTVEIFLL